MQAWLFTILRNQFQTAYRKRWREVEDPDGTYAARLSTAPAQNGHLDLEDLRVALLRLPVEQRETVLLVAGGISYEEAAWRSARSRAGPTALAPVLLSYLALSTRRTSEQTGS
jgi:DNA-directed RNA polymerase specialized sigma24 family protein